MCAFVKAARERNKEYISFFQWRRKQFVSVTKAPLLESI